MSLKSTVFAIVCAMFIAAPALADTYNGTVFTSSPITVKVGQGFLIAIPGNPTTGYSWTAKSSNANITVWGSAYQGPSASAKPMMGAGGQQIFICNANKVGPGVLTFSYARPWEKGAKPARTMTFNVTITK
ncbi:MAG TPA: protease inhibitor I42 family protein [Candidatus Rubrimentiphilum sp.]|nr:protease inhibitor I42 family protein [Candidatus Rubrimentiphilum sp.]